MKLGVVGMMPPDFRAIAGREPDAVRALALTGVGFHIPGDALATITVAECAQVRRIFEDAAMDLVQVGIGYRACLFAPDDGARTALIATICRGLEICRELGAHTCLIRTGSLNPAGPYSPDPANFTSASRERLVASLRRIAEVAEAVG